MKIITLNANGIRSAARKGLFDWLKQENADIICLQETKAQKAQLTDPVFELENYTSYYADALKKGYSGVAIYSRIKPNQILNKMQYALADEEGRFIQLDFNHLSVISLYLPSGTSGQIRQNLKYDFMNKFMEVLQTIRNAGRNYIICGDWNIAHKPIDLKNWRANQKNSGFLPEERAWLTRVFEEIGFIDAFRTVNQEAEQYTWWSNRGQARAKNVGWRIDYQMVTQGLGSKIKSASIYKDQRFSDHAPLIIEYDLEE